MNTISTLYRSWAFKLTTWLLLAAIAGGLTSMVWIASAVKHNRVANHKTNDNPVTVDPVTLLVNHNPDETKDMVKPLTFEAVIRDMRNYPKEFKDSRFVKSNVDKWTVQVMNVVENEVITDYLNTRTNDRNQFSYFRIVDENNQKRFVLTYGVFNSAQEAMVAAKAAKLNLPNNVEAFPEEFKLYMSQMDEYEITPPLQDTGRNAPRDVKLKSTQKVIPAPKAKPVQKKSETTTATDKKSDTHKSQKDSIEKSTNRNDTLNFQESRGSQNNTGNDEKPLKIQKVAPPPLSEERAVREQSKDTPKEKPVKEKAVRERPATPSPEPSNASTDAQ